VRTGTARLVATLLSLVVGMACTGGSPAPEAAVSPTAGRPVVYAAVGASETAGVGTADPFRDAWPRVLWASLPPGSALYDLGVPGSTTEQALSEQLPQAVAVRPDVVTVWLNVNDLVAGVPPIRYGGRLAELVGRLRDAGVTTVLVANTPRLDTLPLYRACRAPDGVYAPPGGPPVRCRTDVVPPLPAPAKVRALVAAYNRQIARVVATEGAVLIDLHALGDVAVTHPAWISRDGFHPSTQGAAAVAELFAAALGALWP
jgi:lysophospholipase L1-like esterase